MSGIGLEPATRRENRSDMANCGKHILEGAAGGYMVENFRRCNEREPISRCSLTQPCLLRHFPIPAVAHHHGVEPITEGVVQIPRHILTRHGLGYELVTSR